MNQNSLLISSCIAVIYALSKYIEVKYLVKEELNIKTIIRDTILVYISSLTGIFIIDQVNTKLDMNNSTPTTSAFTDKPNF